MEPTQLRTEKGLVLTVLVGFVFQLRLELPELLPERAAGAGGPAGGCHCLVAKLSFAFGHRLCLLFEGLCDRSVPLLPAPRCLVGLPPMERRRQAVWRRPRPEGWLLDDTRCLGQLGGSRLMAHVPRRLRIDERRMHSHRLHGGPLHLVHTGLARHWR